MRRATPARAAIAAGCLLAGVAQFPARARGADPLPNECLPAASLQSGWCGDGGPATRALLYSPSSVSAFGDGSFVVMDAGRTKQLGVRLAVVRRVGADGVISVAAGTGRDGSTGDGGPATAAQVSAGALAAMPDGGFLLAEQRTSRVRRVAPGGTITTVAGTGQAGFSGDGGPATAAALNHPRGIAPTADGGYLIADTGNARIRRVAPDGAISTVAGDGHLGTRGDGGPATAAPLRRPTDVAALPGGGFAIVDGPEVIGDTLVRVVLPSGTIFTQHNLAESPGVSCVCEVADPTIVSPTSSSLLLTTFNSVLAMGRYQPEQTIAGGSSCGYGGDGGTATDALFSGIRDISLLPNGGFLVADSGNSRIRRVDATGTVRTVAGGGGRSGSLTGAMARRICAPPPAYSTWNVFELLGVPGRKPVRVKIATTLEARVTITAQRGHRRVAGPVSVLASGEKVVTLAPALAPGRYRVVAKGRTSGQRPKHVRMTLRVPG
jgi:hypothetical protein